MNSWPLSFDLFIHMIFNLSNEQLILIIQNRKGNTITIYTLLIPGPIISLFLFVDSEMTFSGLRLSVYIIYLLCLMDSKISRFLVAIVNEIVLLISSSLNLLIAHRNAIGFWVLISCNSIELILTIFRWNLKGSSVWAESFTNGSH